MAYLAKSVMEGGGVGGLRVFIILISFLNIPFPHSPKNVVIDITKIVFEILDNWCYLKFCNFDFIEIYYLSFSFLLILIYHLRKVEKVKSIYDNFFLWSFSC